MAVNTQVPEKLGLGINGMRFQSSDARMQIPRGTVDRRREQFVSNLNNVTVSCLSEEEIVAIMPIKRSIDLIATVNLANGQATTIKGCWDAKMAELHIGLDCATQSGQEAPYIKMDISKEYDAGSIQLEITQRKDKSVTQELKLNTVGKEAGISFVIESSGFIAVTINGSNEETIKQRVQDIYGKIDFPRCEVDQLYVQELYAKFRQELFRRES